MRGLASAQSFEQKREVRGYSSEQKTLKKQEKKAETYDTRDKMHQSYEILKKRRNEWKKEGVGVEELSRPTAASVQE